MNDESYLVIDPWVYQGWSNLDKGSFIWKLWWQGSEKINTKHDCNVRTYMVQEVKMARPFTSIIQNIMIHASFYKRGHNKNKKKAKL